MAAEDSNRAEDDALLIALKNGSTSAFNSLFEKYWKPLFYFAFRILKDQSICEDIIQDTFTDIWNRRADLKINDVKSYLFQAVKYQTARNFSKVPFTSLHEEAIHTATLLNEVESLIDQEHLLELLDKSMAKLPPRSTQIFKLSRLENLHHKEISKLLNISVRTVETHISLVLRHLRQIDYNADKLLTLLLLICQF
ncbi:MAG: sigma-70 family RNA polymerase sigma factor [Cyclobacteriaceae bacterium]